MMAGSLLGCFSFLAAAFSESVTTVVLLVGVGGGRFDEMFENMYLKRKRSRRQLCKQRRKENNLI
jgi:thiamine pyrophosphokinase